MKRYLLGAVASLAVVGFVMAEEFTLNITAIGDDGSVTGTKGFNFGGGKGKGGGKGGFGKAEEITVKVAKDVKVHKGKFDMDSKGFVADGDNLKLAGLRAAITQAQNGNVMVAGKSLTDKDTLELTMSNGKPAAKLNGKSVPFTDVSVKGKAALAARVTTNDDGVATQVLLTGGGGGGFGGGFKGKGKAKTE
jgi:hypothetical protein